MIVTVDVEKCTGHARCNAASPIVYTLDSDGYSAVHNYEVPAGQESLAREGAAACPERAISIIE
jgi:ferredoxin